MSMMLSTAFEAERPVPLGLLGEFLQHAAGRLRPERHRRPVQPAERAVVLGAPPAAPRGLDRQRHTAVPDAGQHPQVLRPLEVFAVVRDGQVVEIGSRGLRRRDPDLPGAGTAGPRTARAAGAGQAAGEAGDGIQARPAGQGAEQSREGLIAFTDDRDVDAADGTDQFGAHLAVEVGTAEHRHQVRITLLQPPGQRERRGVLLERRAEPGHGHLVPGKGVQHCVQVRGDVHITDLEQLFPGLFR